MEKEYYTDFNYLVYYVSQVYGATKKFKPGISTDLADKIRKTAISIIADLNDYQSHGRSDAAYREIYPIISSVNVLETYLQLAKEYRILKDTSVLNEKLEEMKEVLFRMLEEKNNSDEEDP